MKKLINGLTKRLIKLLEEEEEIFYEEHPFLIDKKAPLELKESDRKYQHTIELQKTVDTLLFELEKATIPKIYNQSTFLLDK